jgi:rubredoxin
MSRYVCSVCGFIYDEELGYPEGGIPPKTAAKDIPTTFKCPICGGAKEVFENQSDLSEERGSIATSIKSIDDEISYTNKELSAIFSNLSKGCDKQYLFEMSELYNQLSKYYENNEMIDNESKFEDLQEMLKSDISDNFVNAKEVASKYSDRGALRALKWSAQVSSLINSYLKKIALKSPEIFKDSNIYVCEICGFIHIGVEKPPICPVCKVPNIKMKQIKRGA